MNTFKYHYTDGKISVRINLPLFSTVENKGKLILIVYDSDIFNFIGLIRGQKDRCSNDVLGSPSHTKPWISSEKDAHLL